MGQQVSITELKEQINSIKDCNLKKNSMKIIFGDGNLDSPIMLVGEAPSVEEDKVGITFVGSVGDLLRKMLISINIKKESIYSTFLTYFYQLG